MTVMGLAYRDVPFLALPLDENLHHLDCVQLIVPDCVQLLQAV